MTLPAIVFWCAAALLTWVYLGYPLLVGAVARLRPLRLRADMPVPLLSVAIAVHDEADQVRERVADALAQDGPHSPVVEVLVGSDGSTDSTEKIVAELAATDTRVRLLVLPRAGQTPTQHALFEAARGDVIVLTDAETRFAEGCLASLATALRDARIGCATGRLDWREVDSTATSANEGLYWRYERAVRALESRAGLLTAVTGALLAVRRSAYRPVPPTASMDHLLPLFVREQGGQVVYVPSAVATDRPIRGVREQFRARARTATRGIRANLSMAGRLAPWRHPGVALAVWSHKLLRWATPILLAVAILAATLAALGGETGYALIPIASALAVGVAAVAQLVAHSGRRPPRALAFVRSFAVVNLAFALAWANVLRGYRIENWRRMEWDARR